MSQNLSTQIHGLFPDLPTAANILRTALHKNQLDKSLQQENNSLTSFFSLLSLAQTTLSDAPSPPPFIVAVEGLDGTGKTTLVKALASSLHPYTTSATGTPPASIAGVRNVFDACGGIVSRAFYMASNYLMQREIRQQARLHPHTVFIADRWYGSTCAYSVAWKNTTGHPDAVDALDQSVFSWPHDLDRPSLMLILQVDHNVRQKRVATRGVLNGPNPWDLRLAVDHNLGKRIMRALFRLDGPRQVHVLDANLRKDQVLRAASIVVHHALQDCFPPSDYFLHQPLSFFRCNSATNGVCEGETGLHIKDKPWYMHITAISTQYSPPFRYQVPIQKADDAGILFLSNERIEAQLANKASPLMSISSVVETQGSEQRWEADGYSCLVTDSECDIMNIIPPASYEAHSSEEISASHNNVLQRESTYGEETPNDCDSNSSDTKKSTTVCVRRFVPMRVELLATTPNRAEHTCNVIWERCNDRKEQWTDSRHLDMISPRNRITHGCTRHCLFPITLVLTGTHCAGKESIGRHIARIFGWSFHAELGDVLREKSKLVAGGHKLGDGSATQSQNGICWDDRIHKEECRRDDLSSFSRVVETWHMGNLAWALFRNATFRKHLVSNAKGAIEKESEKACVLFVHIRVTPEVSVKRHEYDENAKRLPMKDPSIECKALHAALDMGIAEHIKAFTELNIPVLHVNNCVEGAKAMAAVAQKIIEFVNLHRWKQLMYSP